jgi:3-oxoacyl-[acyl-carrier-protein] synthase-3
MKNSYIAGIGHYVPEKVVTNDDLAQHMETSDQWVKERTGIQERRYAKRHEETPTTLAAEATKIALKRADIDKEEIDFIIFATLSPDYFFPGCGVLLQRELGIAKSEIGALDVRNQCSGFVYALSVADQFIKSGMYENILVVGSEVHSMGLDYSTRGRNVAVIFGDGAGAALVRPTDEQGRGILSTHLHSDGRHAEELSFISPGSHGGYHDPETDFGFGDEEFGGLFLTEKMMDEGMVFPYMNGQYVFKYAVKKFPEVIMEALKTNSYTPQDLKLLIPHQANLRIAQFVQKVLKLDDEQVYNNIHKFGNTTAASIPIALSEAWEQGKVEKGDLICLAAFGSGFTWGSALMHW